MSFKINRDWDFIIAEKTDCIEKNKPPQNPQQGQTAGVVPQPDDYADRGYARCFNYAKDNIYTKAIEDLSMAIYLTNSLAKTQINEHYVKRAYSYYINKQYDRAISDCCAVIGKTAVPKTVEESFACELLGNIYEQMGNHLDAVEQYKKVFEHGNYGPCFLDIYRKACKNIQDTE